MKNERLDYTLEGNLIKQRGFKDRFNEVIRQTKGNNLISVNDYMELYVVIKYYDEVFEKDNALEVRELNKCFAKNIDNFLVDVVKTYHSLEETYRKVFFESITKYNKISSLEQLTNLIECDDFNIIDVLRVEKLSKDFSEEIFKYVCNHIHLFERYLDDSFERSNILLYWPEEMSIYYDDLVCIYLNYDGMKIDYCRLILENHITLNKKNLNHLFIIMKRNHALDKDNVKVLSLEKGLENSVRIFIQILYNLNKENYPEMMNKLLRLLYIDDNLRWNVAINKTSDMSILDYINRTGKEEYFQSIGNKENEIKQIYLLKSIDESLHKINTSLEEVIKLLLENNSHVKGFFVNTSPDNASYLQKCRNILIEIESLLHQYKDYVENGSVDKDRIRFMGEEIIVFNIESRHNNTHAYLNNKYQMEFFRLFSTNMNFLAGIKENRNYKSVYETLSKERVNYSSLGSFSKREMDYLIGAHLVELNNDNFIQINERMLSILNDVYENGYVNLMYKDDGEEKEILKLKDRDFLCTDGKLLSTQEINYFNYIMNSKNFLNSISLRNKYVHGTQPSSLEMIEDDYYSSLIVFILVAFNIFQDCSK
ncbi:hypothetical protein [Apilactobacillus nanyangensis]|uniref:hypothetical protein n=1 Tax=Apilactobacillus nanyangensis TaxID=2799579 RepID=UPI001944632B|nr:hypothetical protein [Apilactobacillus nanyangensis]